MNRVLLGMLLILGSTGARAALVASPWQLEFDIQAVQTTSAPEATTLRNTGAEAVTVTAIATFLPPLGVFTRVGGSCGEVPFTIAPQATCTIEHTFRPLSIYTYYETIRMTLADGDYMDFGLAGEGDVGRLVFWPLFGLSFFPTPVGTVSSEQSIHIQNDRNAPVQVTAFTSTSVPAVSAFVRTGGTCPDPPFEFYARSSCTLAYTFAPTQEGQSTMDVTIRTSGASGSFPFSLSGDGTPEASLFADGFEVAAPAPLQ